MAILTAAEILELADGETKELRVQSWELGEMDIKPAWLPEAKHIRALRVRVRPEDKPTGPPYWDITGQTLIEQLLPHLAREDFRILTFRITKHGIAPRARFTVEVTRP